MRSFDSQNTNQRHAINLVFKLNLTNNTDDDENDDDDDDVNGFN